MDSTSFEELLSAIAPKITHQDTVFRNAISPGERLAVTLRYLATGWFPEIVKSLHALNYIGESFASLKYLYRISAQCI